MSIRGLTEGPSADVAGDTFSEKRGKEKEAEVRNEVYQSHQRPGNRTPESRIRRGPTCPVLAEEMRVCADGVPELQLAVTRVMRM